ncbi:ATP-binding protein [Microbacterium sp. Au-Mic1]|uniref:ATP-binding protein n=1 Tax=Microbacterium sp. Au-Mic1 TaxID=2906457 RepID=UPI001E4A51C1|nr:ATP-binding protein [Microbacterium sp. Au-Mic1]MCE4026759.1 ATP-binding protein [Microbacterium sp. Au-Mic1]
MPADLPIGSLLDSEAPAFLNASRLNRHTFWCGQSGSGKTYALGVLLEQVLLHTRLPVVVFDPNSDFVALGKVRDDAPAAEAAALRERDVRVLHSAPGRDDRLLVRFVDMDVRSRAAILQLDPIRDAEDYNLMLRIDAQYLTDEQKPVVEWLRESGDPGYLRIAKRIENLGLPDWEMWAWDRRDVTDIVGDRADATVIDLGHFATPAQMQTAALAVLDELWARRQERIGRLIVIDEAHNLCGPDASTPLQRLLAQRIEQIAAEGRKYGLWLLLSTQRPSKVHPNVISQCDNLALMKMSSERDLAELAEVFGFAPADAIARSPLFAQGQALFAGGFAPRPQLVQMGARLTHEGGSDVPIALR